MQMRRLNVPHEWLFQGQPMVCILRAVRLLQLLPDSQNPESHTRNGIEDHGSRLGHCGIASIGFGSKLKKFKGSGLVVAAALVGGLLPLRPLFLTRAADPTAETIDLILSPLYIIGPLFPPMGDLGEGILLLFAMILNATLYGSLVRYLLRISRRSA
jgi:hypothetical protein